MKSSILLVGNFLSAGGQNPAVGEGLANRLKAAGYLILTTSNKSSRPMRLLDMVSSTWLKRRDYGVAYVEVFSGTAFLWAEAVSGILQLIKRPYVLALHGGNLPAFAARWPGRVMRLLESANIVTAPSRYLLDGMSPYRKDIYLLPNPIELKHYRFRLRSTPKANLVWLRAFHNTYNPPMAPQVVRLIQKAFPEATLTMVGPDKRDGSLQETLNEIEKLGLKSNIEIILGVPKADVPEILQKCDVFINTTNVDNMPVSVMEAMACGMCIVSTDVGGIPYLLEDGKDALLVPADNPEAMAKAIERILCEPGLAEHLSYNARQKAEEFDWQVIYPKWESLFLDVAANI